MRGGIPQVHHHLHNGGLEGFIAHNVIHAGQKVLGLYHHFVDVPKHLVHAFFFASQQKIPFIQITVFAVSRGDVDEFIPHDTASSNSHLGTFGYLYAVIYLHAHSNTAAIVLYGGYMPHRYPGQSHQGLRFHPHYLLKTGIESIALVPAELKTAQHDNDRGQKCQSCQGKSSHLCFYAHARYSSLSVFSVCRILKKACTRSSSIC